MGALTIFAQIMAVWLVLSVVCALIMGRFLKEMGDDNDR